LALEGAQFTRSSRRMIWLMPLLCYTCAIIGFAVAQLRHDSTWFARSGCLVTTMVLIPALLRHDEAVRRALGDVLKELDATRYKEPQKPPPTPFAVASLAVMEIVCLITGS